MLDSTKLNVENCLDDKRCIANMTKPMDVVWSDLLDAVKFVAFMSATSLLCTSKFGSIFYSVLCVQASHREPLKIYNSFLHGKNAQVFRVTCKQFLQIER